MAFGQLNSGEDMPMAEINVTPLVDVMLVLLIVFMVTMPVLTHSIPLQLPVASGKNTSEPKEPLRLSISERGEYVLGETTFGLPELTQQFREANQSNPDTVLAIAADKGAAYDYVAQVLAAARDAGLHKVGFVTEEKQ
ncbi:ExbD/TolR family protein [Stenoxybacter acetivorans]|uniref:ExbD/TolR family protein n=1 Tax=Stenoxybacter acetivorans TaxID=422441 RepID=UPI00056A3BAC|nr:biopolymer transporter ExbD [Stenoxybacter acetivorans]